ncbi:hypothetical protein YC2023_045629 [Brassica napus]
MSSNASIFISILVRPNSHTCLFILFNIKATYFFDGFNWFSNICLYKLTLNPKRDPLERRHLCITCELPFLMHGPNTSWFSNICLSKPTLNPKRDPRERRHLCITCELPFMMHGTKRKSIIPKHTRHIDIETVVVIVGAKPAGLTTSVCLNQHSIPNVILEKEDIYASLRKSTIPKHTRYIDIETVVVIVGARPTGLAISVCLNQHSIPNVILEKEDIYASLASFLS